MTKKVAMEYKSGQRVEIKKDFNFPFNYSFEFTQVLEANDYVLTIDRLLEKSIPEGDVSYVIKELKEGVCGWDSLQDWIMGDYIKGLYEDPNPENFIYSRFELLDL